MNPIKTNNKKVLIEHLANQIKITNNIKNDDELKLILAYRLLASSYYLEKNYDVPESYSKIIDKKFKSLDKDLFKKKYIIDKLHLIDNPDSDSDSYSDSDSDITSDITFINNTINTMWDKECNICFNNSHEPIILNCCKQSICFTCIKKMELCPFCRYEWVKYTFTF